MLLFYTPFTEEKSFPFSKQELSEASRYGYSNMALGVT